MNNFCQELIRQSGALQCYEDQIDRIVNKRTTGEVVCDLQRNKILKIDLRSPCAAIGHDGFHIAVDAGQVRAAEV